MHSFGNIDIKMCCLLQVVFSLLLQKLLSSILWPLVKNVHFLSSWKVVASLYQGKMVPQWYTVLPRKTPCDYWSLEDWCGYP